MIGNIFKMLFNNNSAEREQEDARSREEHSKIAVCALLLELAASSGENVDAVERDVIFSLVREKFDLSHEDAEELIKISQQELKESIDIWKFTKLLNENYSRAERINLLDMLWRVVYADGRLSGHEDFFMHKIATLMKIEHKDLINAKIRAKESSD